MHPECAKTETLDDCEEAALLSQASPACALLHSPLPVLTEVAGFFAFDIFRFQFLKSYKTHQNHIVIAPALQIGDDFLDQNIQNVALVLHVQNLAHSQVCF